MTEWERVALRVQQNKLKKWDAVCTPYDPDLPDDEFPNTLPHLYDDRSKLIREAVEELISREAGNLDSAKGSVDVDTSELEEKVDLVRADTRDILDVVEQMEGQVDQLWRRQQEGRQRNLVPDVYEVLPHFESEEQAREQIQSAMSEERFVDDEKADRASEYGNIADLAEYLGIESAEMLNVARRMRDDVDEIQLLAVNRMPFLVEVEE
ncbi:hypothetical protein [Halopiger thermotolerans]